MRGDRSASFPPHLWRFQSTVGFCDVQDLTGARHGPSVYERCPGWGRGAHRFDQVRPMKPIGLCLLPLAASCAEPGTPAATRANLEANVPAVTQDACDSVAAVGSSETLSRYDRGRIT